MRDVQPGPDVFERDMMTDSGVEAKLRVLVALNGASRHLLRLFESHKIDVCLPNEINKHLISQGKYDLILLEEDGESLAAIRAADPRAEIILFGKSEEAAVESVARGASAYFLLPPDLERLAETIANITEVFSIRRETGRLEKLLQERYIFRGVVAKNPQMLEIFNYMRRVAPHYRTITITGETGTGKEMIAQALHSLNPGTTGSFVACNCGGFVEGLIDSELFGHKKGAFTGAVSDNVGLFGTAGDGTVFLDEIGLMPLSSQPHLLRVLQTGEYRRVGTSQPSKAKCKVITATNEDLTKAVKKGTFREDLYYRITPLTIHLPALKERKDDIPLLCRHFLQKFNKNTGKNIRGISQQAQTAMMSYSWPGNIRELENVLEQAVIMTTRSFIDLGDLPSVVAEAPQASAPLSPLRLENLITNHIREVLSVSNGNRTRAAKMLGISRRALQRRLAKCSSS